MHDSEEVDMDGVEESKSPPLSGNRVRAKKKKSTLAKLKERKEREQGSNLSLQKRSEADGSVHDAVLAAASEVIQTDSVRSTNSGKPAVYHFSTKDPRTPPVENVPETNRRERPPRPKPRARKNSWEAQNGAERSTSSDAVTLERLQNLKMAGETDSFESVSQGGFVPKPPVTPRTPRSAPRTPRGFLVPGKGEKRNREPGLSGDELEVVEKREKNGDTLNGHRRSGIEKDSMCDRDDMGKLQTSSHSTTRRRNSSEKQFRDKRDEDNSCDVRSDRKRQSHKKTLERNNSSDNYPETLASTVNSDTEGTSQDQVKPKPRGRLSSKGNKSSLNNSPENERKDKLNLPSTPPPRDRSSHSSHSRSVSTPPSGRLHPITPRSHPPPMNESVSSRSLRTAYKIDPNIRPSTGSTQTPTVEKSDGSTQSNADKVSQRSFASGSVLPTITTQEARSRSFLEGSVSSGTPSILGSEELDRYFPERKVNVLVATWNMNELKDIDTGLLNDFILPERCHYVQDIYAVGTQENGMNKKEWEIKLQETLGPSHVMYHSVTLGSLHLVVYIRRDLIWFCSLPEDDAVSLRAVTMVKTKGAIGISFSLFGTSYLFINCHLTSDRDNDNSKKKHRLGDYFKVIQEMKLPKNPQNSFASKKTADITTMFDCVFWFGDLNFRIERKRHAVEGKVSEITSEKFPHFETLLGGDQLHKYMSEGKIFSGFLEGRINFHPTFKYDVNEDTYDSSTKNRVPSYTDRVMFRSKKKNDVTCLHYDAVKELKLSDHRAVYSQFETGIKPGKDDLVYAAGHFDRSVYMEANRRRATKQPLKKKVSSVCSVQ